MRYRRLFLFTFAAFGLATLLGVSASAQDALKGKTYYFGTSEPRTNISFSSDAEIETIQGTTQKMDRFNSKITVAASGKKSSGSLRVGVAQLKTGIALRDEHLRSPIWLDAKRFPWITLKLTEITEDKDARNWSFKGTLSIKGVTRPLAGKARVLPIPTSVKGLGAGEWVRVWVKFDVDITKFGIVIPKQVGAKVSKVWKVGVDIFGTTAVPKRRR